MTTVLDVQRFKDEHRRFAVLTAYDYLSARILDEAGIPILLVGDSLGMVMLGYPTTLPVTLDEMIHHAKAVARGSRQSLLVGDMPFMSYHVSVEQAIASAGRFIQEGGMHAVKLEGGGRIVRADPRRREGAGAGRGLQPRSGRGSGRAWEQSHAGTSHPDDRNRRRRRHRWPGPCLPRCVRPDHGQGAQVREAIRQPRRGDRERHAAVRSRGRQRRVSRA